jgi:hypothetical protein
MNIMPVDTNSSWYFITFCDFNSIKMAALKTCELEATLAPLNGVYEVLVY